jgi:hypothetical protein
VACARDRFAAHSGVVGNLREIDLLEDLSIGRKIYYNGSSRSCMRRETWTGSIWLKM